MLIDLLLIQYLTYIIAISLNSISAPILKQRPGVDGFDLLGGTLIISASKAPWASSAELQMASMTSTTRLMVRRSGGCKRALGTRASMTSPQGPNQQGQCMVAAIAG